MGMLTRNAAATASTLASGPVTPPLPSRRVAGGRLRPGTSTAGLVLAADVVMPGAAATVVPGVATSTSVLLVAAAVTMWALQGLYRTRYTLSALDDLPRLLGGLLAAAGVVLLLPDAVRAGSTATDLIRVAPVVALAVVAARVLAYGGVRTLRAHGQLTHRVVVVGTGDVATRFARAARRCPGAGVRVLGFVGDGPDAAELPEPLLSGQRGLRQVLEEHEADAVVLAFGALPDHEVVPLLRACHDLGCEVLVVPRLFEVTGPGRGLDRVWSVPLVRLGSPATRRPSWRVKRLLDVALAGTALVLLWPVLALTALAVRVETGPSVIFRQERIGRDGRPFTVYKFRSLRASDTESRTRWNVVDDGRMGPVGRVIRATSLDELPQLVNVLRGDMTLVGPRPERPFFVEEFSTRHRGYADRHRVPVGLTGWAAVNGLRGDTSIADRADFDNHYIDGWSLWLDVAIVVRTVAAVFRRAEPRSPCPPETPSP